MTNIICISCPKGCHLSVDEQNDFAVIGNACPRGEVYGKAEFKNPVRTVTSTVKIKGALYERLPVKTDKAISKGLVFDAMKLINDVQVIAPIKMGDIILKNILGTDVNIVATKTAE